VRREFEAQGATLGEVVHGADVEFAVHVPEDVVDALVARVNDLAQGAAVIEEIADPDE
jgi:hypothetical protein